MVPNRGSIAFSESVVARPKPCCTSRFHSWYCGAMIRWVALVNDGTTNSGLLASISASVCPAAKPCTNDVLACATSAAWLPATAGDRGALPAWNGLFSGELFSRLSAIVAGNASVNRPKPPRITVLVPAPNGLQAKPILGCQLRLV